MPLPKNFYLTTLLKNATNILIVCHQRPDGDTLGSGLCLYFLAKALNKNPYIVSDSEVPSQYGFMQGIEHLNADYKKIKFDLTIVVDCADSLRMGKFQDYAKSTLSVNIDHHKTNDRFAKYNVVDENASSTCQLVYSILKTEKLFADKSIPKETKAIMATSLMVGLSTDTGHFMHSSVDSKVLETATELSKLGANIHEISSNIYRSRSKEKVLLLSKALSNLRFFNDDQICIMSLTLKDFETASQSPLDTEGFIDFGLSIKSTMVSVTITQSEENFYKVSFRSKGIDVSRVASVFGGGGHTRAAGCAVHGKYEDVKDKVLKAIRDEL